MYPNQPYSQPGGGTGAPYPPYSQQQQQYASPYGSATGSVGGYQQNMSAPYGGNQSGHGNSSNPYAQGSHPQGGNPYGQGSQPQGGNPYGQGSQPQGGNPYGQGSHSQGGNPYAAGGYGMSGGGSGPSGYPPSGQQSYGSSGSGYPPQHGGGYPPQGGSSGYPPQSGSSGYPPQGGSSGYPSQSGGYPGQQPPYPSHGAGGYPGGQQGGDFGARGVGQNPDGVLSNDQRQQQLNQIISRYEINQQFASRLNILANCEIVLLCDDSGSMNTPLQNSNQTRWEELKSLVNIVIDISAVMDANGIDIYFLNREPVLNVTNPQNIRHIFNSPPSGLTPLVPALRRILQAKRSQTFEKKLLILIATDGAPTNDRGQTDIGSLEAVLRQERTPQTYITFLACTDDLDSVNYLSNWDKSMPNLDVIDDYRSEKMEIQRVRGGNFPFSFGDYIVKALLGSIDPWFDSLDERA